MSTGKGRKESGKKLNTMSKEAKKRACGEVSDVFSI
jgi:hypothetical protein